MSTKKSRIEYLDLLKGISIILVIFCHKVLLSSDTILGNVVMAIAWAAVPNFFFVTGGLMQQAKEWRWKKYLKKLLHAYTVLCVWKLLYLVFYSAFLDIHFSKMEAVEYLFVFGDIEGVDTGHLWFMYAYLCVLLFYPVSWFLFQGGRKGREILAFVSVVLFSGTFLVTAGNFVLQRISGPEGPAYPELSLVPVFPFGRYANMMFFFIAGGFLLAYRERITDFLEKHHIRTVLPVALMVAGTIGLLLGKYCETGTFAWNNTYIVNGYSRLMTVVLSFGLYLLIQNLPVNRAGRFLGKWFGTNTMGIYYLHMPMLAYFQINLSAFCKPYYSFGLNVVKTLIVLLFCTGITLAVKKIPIVKTIVE